MKKYNISDFIKRYRLGVLLTILACFCYAASSVLSASIIKIVGSSYIVATRYVLQGLLISPFILRNPKPVYETNPKEWIYVIISAVSIGIGAYLGYLSLAYIPVMDITVIFNCQPVIVFIISSIWLKEKVTITDVLMLLSVMIGVILVCQPTFLFGSKNLEDFGGLSMSWHGYVFSFATCIGTSLTLCLMKRVQSVGPSFILLIQSIVVVIIVLITSFVLKDGHDPENAKQLLFLLSSSFLSSSARGLLTSSLMFEDATIISVFSCFEILFSLILQMIVFRIYPNIAGFFGATLVVIGVIGIIMKNQLKILFSKKIKFLRIKSNVESEPLIK